VSVLLRYTDSDCPFGKSFILLKNQNNSPFIYVVIYTGLVIYFIIIFVYFICRTTNQHVAF
jgi:hypothetical protein